MGGYIILKFVNINRDIYTHTYIYTTIKIYTLTTTTKTRCMGSNIRHALAESDSSAESSSSGGVVSRPSRSSTLSSNDPTTGTGAGCLLGLCGTGKWSTETVRSFTTSSPPLPPNAPG